jgi:hypothetical protein
MVFQVMPITRRLINRSF